MQSAMAATRGGSIAAAAAAPRAAAGRRSVSANVAARPCVRVASASAEPMTSGTEIEFT